MQEFTVRFCSFQEIQQFVELAGMEAFPILVGDDNYQVSGTSFMGMFSLDHSKPMRVMMDCPQEAFEGFRQKAQRILNQT